MVDAYIQYQTQPKKRNAGDVLLVFHTQMEEAEQQLGIITDKMQVLEDSFGVLTAGNESSNVILRRLASLSQELSAAQIESLKAKSDYDAAARTLPKDGPAPDAVAIVSTDDEQALRGELKQLQATFQEMHHRYLPGHPALRTDAAPH